MLPMPTSADAETAAAARAAAVAIDTTTAGIRRATGLERTSLSDAFAAFTAGITAGATALTRPAFSAGLAAIARASDSSASPSVVDALAQFLFDAFDEDGSGDVDLRELGSGLSALCGGTRDEKLRAAFRLYDADGDGVISLDEMTRYLASVFRLTYASRPGARAAMGGKSPEQLAAVSAHRAFRDAGIESDSALTWEEFSRWARLHSGEKEAQEGKSAADESARESMTY